VAEGLRRRERKAGGATQCGARQIGLAQGKLNLRVRQEYTGVLRIEMFGPAQRRVGAGEVSGSCLRQAEFVPAARIRRNQRNSLAEVISRASEVAMRKGLLAGALELAKPGRHVRVLCADARHEERKKQESAHRYLTVQRTGAHQFNS
jgi:hypothetical protein